MRNRIRLRILLTWRRLLRTAPPSRDPAPSVLPSQVVTNPLLSGAERAMPICEKVKTTMSPAWMSLPCGFFVQVVLSCARDHASKPHADAVFGRLKVAVSFTLATFIASLTTQHTKAAHHGHPVPARSVAAWYSRTRFPLFVPLTSSTPISPTATVTIVSGNFILSQF